jgi:hypothetical protein
MSDKNITLKKLLFNYHAEANTLLRADYYGADYAITRFLAYIEGEQVIKAFLDDCVQNHVPKDFDADKEIEGVSQPNTVFVNFGPDYLCECGVVYLILKSVEKSGGIGKGYFLYGYGDGSHKYNDMLKGFMDFVIRRLIDGIDRHLTGLGIERGLNDTIYNEQNVIAGDHSNIAVSQVSGGSTASVTQSNRMDAAELGKLLGDLEASLKGLAEQDRNDAKECADALREELSAERPKRSVVKTVLTGLKRINGGTQFAAAVAAIVQFVTASGF